MTTLPRPIPSCRCHPGAEVVECPRCGAEAYAWRSRPGVDRDWRADHPGWSCSHCGARGQRFELVAAAA